jgi:hypothetical protein
MPKATKWAGRHASFRFDAFAAEAAFGEGDSPIVHPRLNRHNIQIG